VTGSMVWPPPPLSGAPTTATPPPHEEPTTTTTSLPLRSPHQGPNALLVRPPHKPYPPRWLTEGLGPPGPILSGIGSGVGGGVGGGKEWRGAKPASCTDEVEQGGGDMGSREEVERSRHNCGASEEESVG
jgi:hypothetical protein